MDGCKDDVCEADVFRALCNSDIHGTTGMHEFIRFYSKVSDRFVDDVVSGKQVKFPDYDAPLFFEILFGKLKVHEYHAECIYWAAICNAMDNPIRQQYLEKAYKLGSISAMYEYGKSTGNVELGVLALKQGYKSSDDSYEWQIIKSLMDSNEIVQRKSNFPLEVIF